MTTTSSTASASTNTSTNTSTSTPNTALNATLTNPADAIVDGVERSLALARTWLGWDGRPRLSEDGARIYTPAKVVRRIGDHLIDHLAEVECLLAGVPSQLDEWHASLVTMDGDWARFTEVELEEAEQRLRRLARTCQLRFADAGQVEWDRERAESWTLRQIADHLASSWYAEQVGAL